MHWNLEYGVGEGVGKEFTMETDSIAPKLPFKRIQARFSPARLASRHDPDSTKSKKALGHQNNFACAM